MRNGWVCVEVFLSREAPVCQDSISFELKYMRTATFPTTAAVHIVYLLKRLPTAEAAL